MSPIALYSSPWTACPGSSGVSTRLGTENDSASSLEAGGCGTRSRIAEIYPCWSGADRPRARALGSDRNGIPGDGEVKPGDATYGERCVIDITARRGPTRATMSTPRGKCRSRRRDSDECGGAQVRVTTRYVTCGRTSLWAPFGGKLNSTHPSPTY